MRRNRQRDAFYHDVYFGLLPISLVAETYKRKIILLTLEKVYRTQIKCSTERKIVKMIYHSDQYENLALLASNKYGNHLFIYDKP